MVTQRSTTCVCVCVCCVNSYYYVIPRLTYGHVCDLCTRKDQTYALRCHFVLNRLHYSLQILLLKLTVEPRIPSMCAICVCACDTCDIAVDERETGAKYFICAKWKL